MDIETLKKANHDIKNALVVASTLLKDLQETELKQTEVKLSLKALEQIKEASNKISSLYLNKESPE